MDRDADLKLTSELPPDTRYGNSYLYVRLVTRHPANRHLSQDQQTSTAHVRRCSVTQNWSNFKFRQTKRSNGASKRIIWKEMIWDSRWHSVYWRRHEGFEEWAKIFFNKYTFYSTLSIEHTFDICNSKMYQYACFVVRRDCKKMKYIVNTFSFSAVYQYSWCTEGRVA